MTMPARASAVVALVLAGWAPVPTTKTDDGQTICRIASRPAPLIGLHEASGVAASRRADVLWAHNDSGDPVLVTLDGNGNVKGRVRVTGASVDDWEDIAIGPCPSGSCLYIADIGDNDRKRSHITVYRVPEPDAGAVATSAAQAFHATYPDGPQDAEALFVTKDAQIFIVTKGVGAPIGMYRFPPGVRSAATVTLEQVSKVAAKAAEDERITGASASGDGAWVALRTHATINLFRTAELVAGRWQPAHKVDVRELREPQGEGVAIGRNGTVYMVGEGGKHLKAGTFARLACTLDHP